MSHPTTTSVLSQLSDEVRDALTDWLADGDLNWQPGQIERQLDSLPPELQAFRHAAIAELVKIDIVKMWRREMETLLESYLERFPELGTADTVTPDLIVAELEARKLAGKPASGREISARFPQQINAVRKLVSGSSLVAVSGVQPSPVAKAQQRTASLGPAETHSPKPMFARGAITVGAAFGNNGRYRIVKELGGGGMGAVYLATDSELGDRKVAIKVPHFSATDSGDVLERFKREAALLAAISHHNLGIVFDVNQFEGVHFLVMEFIDGTSLGTYIKTHTLQPQQSVSIVRKVASALQAAHAKGVVHRDLKPDNIMLNKDGQPKVIDFGLAVNVKGGGPRVTHSGITMGTPEYMPIEQVNGDLAAIGPRSDVYSLGIVLYKLLTETVPFPGDNLMEVVAKIIQHEAASPCEHRPDLDPRLAEIVLKAIAKQPEDRFDSMADFEKALAGYRRTESISPLVTSIGTPALRVSGHSETGGLTPPARLSGTRLSETQVAVDRNDEESFPSFNDITVAASNPTTVSQKLRSRWQKLSPPARLITIATGFATMLLLGVILYFRNGDALVKIEVSADDIEVTFVDQTIKLTDGEREYRVTPGEHRLHIKTGNAEFDTEVFTLKKGNNPAIKVEILKNELIAKAGDKEIEVLLADNVDSKEESGTELLTNGGCEAPDDGNNIAGWSTKFGLWFAETGESFPFKGKACFRPGPSLAASLFQDVSLEPYAEQIKNGQLEISFRGHVLSTSGDDQAQFIVQFLDKSKLGITDFYNTGSMSLTRKWQENSKAGIVPTTAAYVRVHLVTALKKVDGRNVFFDNISLKARTVGGEPLVCIPADAKSFGNHSYQFYDERLSWKEAKAKCELLGGNLVIIDSAEENKFVANLVAMAAWQDAWIGLTDEAQEGKWLTVTDQPLSFTNWFLKQPDNASGIEHFALMSNREVAGQRIAWQWCDQPNWTFSLHQPGFVCEWNTIRAAAKGPGSVASPQSAVATVSGEVEVLKNGSCEEPIVNGEIPGWRILSGKWYACRTNNIAQPKHGQFYFHPGPVALGELIQDVPLNEYGDQIDAGRIEVSFNGFVRSSPKYGDFSQVIIEFRDRDNRRTLDTYDSKKIRSMRGWVPVTDKRIAPKETRWARVRLISSREIGTSNDGYYDGLSLMVRPRADKTGVGSDASSRAKASESTTLPNQPQAAEIAKLKQVLVSQEWKYFDSRYPPGDTCRFSENGTFHRWKWSYWIVGPKTMHVQFWDPKYDPNKCLVFTFDDDFTRCTAKNDQFTITMTAIKPLGDPKKAAESNQPPQEELVRFVIGLGHGKWKIENGELWCAEPSGDFEDWLFFGNPKWTDYDFTVRATCAMPLTGHGPGIFFRSLSNDHATFAAMNVFKSPQDYMDEIDGTSKRSSWNDSSIPRYVGPTVRDWSGNGHEIKASVRGKTVQISVDGVPTIKYDQLRQANGYVGVRSHKDWPSRYRNPKVISPDGKVLLDGWPTLPPEITAR